MKLLAIADGLVVIITSIDGLIILTKELGIVAAVVPKSITHQCNMNTSGLTITMDQVI